MRACREQLRRALRDVVYGDTSARHARQRLTECRTRADALRSSRDALVDAPASVSRRSAVADRTELAELGRLTRKRLLLLALTLLVSSAIAPFLAASLPGGAFAVASESMEPSIPRGSLVLARPGTADVDDVIVYLDPGGVYQVHRVVEERRIGDDTYYFTRGDGNHATDSFAVPSERVEGIVSGHVPGVGTLWLLPPLAHLAIFGTLVLTYLVVVFATARPIWRRWLPRWMAAAVVLLLVAPGVVVAGIHVDRPASPQVADVADPAPGPTSAGDEGTATTDATGAEATATVSPASQGTPYTFDHVLATSAPSGSCDWTYELEVRSASGTSALASFSLSMRDGPASATLTDVLPVNLTRSAVFWTGTYAYVLGGYNGTGPVDTVYRYDPDAGTATELTETLPAALDGPAAVWTGTAAYVFGGHDGTTTVDTILRYTPSNGTIQTLSTVLPTPHSRIAAAWTGTYAYLFGGEKADGHGADSVLRFDPATLTVTDTGGTVTKAGASSAVWSGSSVYVFSGDDAGGYKRETYVFDVTTETLTRVADLPDKRTGTAAVWHGGAAYLFGGNAEGSGTTDTILRYDPDADAYETLADVLPQPRKDAGAFIDGDVVHVVGGEDGSAEPLASVATYSFASTAFEALRATLPAQRTRTAAVWDGSTAHVLGGEKPDGKADKAISAYDPAAHEVTAAGFDVNDNSARTAAVWTGADVYVFQGDDNGGYKDKVVLYEPGVDRSDTGDRIPNKRSAMSAVWNGTHAILFGGQDDGGAASDEILAYDPDAGTFTTMTSTLPSPRYATSAVWDGAYAYVVGGYNETAAAASDEVLRYDPATDTLTRLAVDLPTALYDTAAVLVGTDVYVVGGRNASGHGADVHVIDLDAETVTTIADALPTARSGTSAVWTGEHIVVFGGRDASGVLDEVLVFEPGATSASDMLFRSTADALTLSGGDELQHVLEVETQAAGTATIDAWLVATCAASGIETRQAVTYEVS